MKQRNNKKKERKRMMKKNIKIKERNYVEKTKKKCYKVK